jgi:predicted DNA-binding protein YlxM (UPF0122 family)
MFDSIFADGELKQFLLSKNENTKWINTPFEKYSNLTTKTKGEFGELFVKKCLSLKGHHIAKRKNSGHDCLVDNIKTEIKFSLDGVINHVSLYKDWERIIFCFIKQPEEDSLIIYMNKDDFTKHMSSGYSVFNRQQGGKNSNNDDYMCGEKDLILLKSTGQAKCITEWIAKNPSKEFIITKRNTIEDYAI